MLKILNKN